MKLVSLIAAALLLAAPAAYAARDISSPAEILTIGTGNTSIDFGNTFSRRTSLAGDTFGDQFFFSLAGVSDISFGVKSISASATQGLDITGFSLYNASTGSLAAPGTLVSTGAIESWTLDKNGLAAGNYFFLVSGKVVSGGGSFSADGTVSVSPVPEPAVPAMLLGGLAVLAVAARRQRKS